jgi:hypothetical protein
MKSRKQIYARRTAEIAQRDHIELNLDAVTVFVQQAPYRPHHTRAIVRALAEPSTSEAHRILWNAATHSGASYFDAVDTCTAIRFEPISTLEPLPEVDPWAEFDGIVLLENDDDWAAASLADQMADEFEPLVVLAQ